MEHYRNYKNQLLVIFNLSMFRITLKAHLWADLWDVSKRIHWGLNVNGPIESHREGNQISIHYLSALLPWPVQIRSNTPCHSKHNKIITITKNWYQELVIVINPNSSCVCRNKGIVYFASNFCVLLKSSMSASMFWVGIRTH